MVGLAAPGKDVYSTYVGGESKPLAGTSMASPHVSGAAGLLRGNGYGHGKARTRLQNAAENVGLSSYEQGYGLLDVAASLWLYSGDD